MSKLDRPTSCLTHDQASTLFASGWWKGRSAHDIALVQLYEAKLIAPADVFYDALSEVMGYKVGNRDLAFALREMRAKLLLDLPNYEQEVQP